MTIQSLEKKSLTLEEVHSAINSLNLSIEAATNGQAVAQYISHLLKFVAKVIL
jgi:recombinational DNA repair protein RecR